MKANMNLLFGLSAVIALSMIFAVSGQTATTTTPAASQPAPTNATAPSGVPPSGSQPAPTNATAASGVPPSGSQPAPNNSTALSGVPPSGSQPAPSGSNFNPNANGGIASEANFNNTKLPPLDNPRLAQSIANLDDTYLNKLKNIIKFLPPMEQDVIAKCFSSNTDTTRVLSPDCYKTEFTDVKSQSAQGIGSELTNNSKATRNSLSCLTKITQTFGTTTDTAATNINSEVGNIVAGQATFNNCAAVFSKAVIEVLNARRRFLITTKANIDTTLTVNAQGNSTGFIYTSDEQTAIVSAFKTYADCVSTFTTSMTQSVVKVQALVGQLSACKAPTNTTAPARTRGLQATTTTANTTAAPSGAPTGSAPSGAAPSGAPSGSAAKPSGSMPSGGKGLIQFDANGMPIIGGVSAASVTNVNAVYTTATAKNNPAWTTLATKLNANVINMGSINSVATTFRMMPSLFPNIINRFAEKDKLNDEFNKAVKQDACTADYLFYCTSGSCYCTEAACPNAVAGTMAINEVKKNLSFNTNTTIPKKAAYPVKRN